MEHSISAHGNSLDGHHLKEMVRDGNSGQTRVLREVILLSGTSSPFAPFLPAMALQIACCKTIGTFCDSFEMRAASCGPGIVWEG